MARVENILTHDLWDVTYEQHASSMKHMNVIDYYDKGVKRMQQHIKKIMHSRSWSEIVEAEDDKLISEINKTISFYRKRLKEK